MAALTRYYFWILLNFIFLMSYNLIHYSKYADTPCCKLITPPVTEATNKSSSISGDLNLGCSGGEYKNGTLVKIVSDKSNGLTTMPFIIGICYGMISGLYLIEFLGVWYFSDRLAPYFKSYNILKKIIGFLLKVIPLIVTILHYVIFILIAIQWQTIFGKTDCKNAVIITSTGDYAVGVPWTDASNQLLVLTFFWALLHLVYPLIKRFIYIDNFAFVPADYDRNVVLDILFVKLGP